jgi:hypothetical protein
MDARRMSLRLFLGVVWGTNIQHLNQRACPSFFVMQNEA